MVKDIVSESAATYVSILHTEPDMPDEPDAEEKSPQEVQTAFSLPRFIPLLKERIMVISPFTRMFLVGWVTLLDSIPDLELVTYLPEFLGGLFIFLSDANRDVHVATASTLDRFLTEIKRISRVKKGIEESRKSRSEGRRKRSGSTDSEAGSEAPDDIVDEESVKSGSDEDEKAEMSDNDWIPGQDVHVNHREILEILTKELGVHGMFVPKYRYEILTIKRGRAFVGVPEMDC